MTIGVLCSGRLGLHVLRQLFKRRNVIFVCTDKESFEIKNFCLHNKVPVFVGNPRKGRAFSFLKDFKIEVLISVNYLFLIEEDLINVPEKMAFNIHGSLLPKYRGRTPHVWAIINNEKETGITAHKIEAGCDTGAVLEQIVVPISKTDTGASILNKYELLYFPLIEEV